MSNSGTKRFRRRELISNPRVQLKIIGFFAAMALVYSVFNCYLSLISLGDLADSVLSLPLAAATRWDVSVMVDQQRSVLGLQLAVFTFLAVSVVLLGGVALSHKIGGPVYQLNKYMREVVKGQTPPRLIRFRKYDFFWDLATSFNEFQGHYCVLPPAEESPSPEGTGGQKGVASPE